MSKSKSWFTGRGRSFWAAVNRRKGAARIVVSGLALFGGVGTKAGRPAHGD